MNNERYRQMKMLEGELKNLKREATKMKAESGNQSLSDLRSISVTLRFHQTLNSTKEVKSLKSTR
jgi:hypothetical protein